MKGVTLALVVAMLCSLSYTKDRGKIVLQQGRDSYTGCLDSYVSKEHPSQNNVSADKLAMEHWYWG